MNESELYKELGMMTKDKSKWDENIPYVSSLLNHEFVKIQAKALWLLGEMVFEPLLHDTDDKVRMEAPEIFRVLGKRRPEIVFPFIEQLQKIAETDSNRVVRIHSLGAIKATTSK